MAALLDVRNATKHFGSIVALADVSLALNAGEIHCLLGDNGAGKSTLIQILSGYHRPTAGRIFFEGMPVEFYSPTDALDLGIATVYQDLGLVPLMSVMRNFFMGREPLRLLGPLPILNKAFANRVVVEQLRRMGITLRDPAQPVGTMSGGERQSLAIARAVYFGAKVLILDEPTSALGVRQTAIVLKSIAELRRRGIGIIFITHNVRHAWAVGNRFTILNRGRVVGSFERAATNRAQIEELMAGGQELIDLTAELNSGLADI